MKNATTTLNTVTTPLDINVTNISHHEIDHLASLITKWQKDPQFMRFLKEHPMTQEENFKVLKEKIASENVMIKTISETHIKDIIGFILFHNFDPQEKSLEISFRIDPNNQKKGACTHAVKNSLHDVLANPLIEKIVGRHSVWNQGSFNVFRKSGFTITDFVPQQTFLQNIGKTTDDFKREITKNFLITNNGSMNGFPRIAELNKDKIVEGLKQHKFI